MGVRKKLPDEQILNTRDPKKRYALMAADVRLLYEHERFTSCTMLLLCFVDAMASQGLKAHRGAFGKFVEKQFPELYQALDGRVPGRKAGDLLYDCFRNGLTHGLELKSDFALCRKHELNDAYVENIKIDGVGSFIGLNVDRLVEDFLSYVQKKHEEVA